MSAVILLWVCSALPCLLEGHPQNAQLEAMYPSGSVWGQYTDTRDDPLVDNGFPQGGAAVPQSSKSSNRKDSSSWPHYPRDTSSGHLPYPPFMTRFDDRLHTTHRPPPPSPSPGYFDQFDRRRNSGELSPYSLFMFEGLAAPEARRDPRPNFSSYLNPDDYDEEYQDLVLHSEEEPDSVERVQNGTGTLQGLSRRVLDQVLDETVDRYKWHHENISIYLDGEVIVTNKRDLWLRVYKALGELYGADTSNRVEVPNVSFRDSSEARSLDDLVRDYLKSHVKRGLPPAQSPASDTALAADFVKKAVRSFGNIHFDPDTGGSLSSASLLPPTVLTHPSARPSLGLFVPVVPDRDFDSGESLLTSSEELLPRERTHSAERPAWYSRLQVHSPPVPAEELGPADWHTRFVKSDKNREVSDDDALIELSDNANSWLVPAQRVPGEDLEISSGSSSARSSLAEPVHYITTSLPRPSTVPAPRSAGPAHLFSASRSLEGVTDPSAAGTVGYFRTGVSQTTTPEADFVKSPLTVDNFSDAQKAVKDFVDDISPQSHSGRHAAAPSGDIVQSGSIIELHDRDRPVFEGEEGEITSGNPFPTLSLVSNATSVAQTLNIADSYSDDSDTQGFRVGPASLPPPSQLSSTSPPVLSDRPDSLTPMLDSSSSATPPGGNISTLEHSSMVVAAGIVSMTPGGASRNTSGPEATPGAGFTSLVTSGDDSDPLGDHVHLAPLHAPSAFPSLDWVSVECDDTGLQATLRFSGPFAGTVYTQTTPGSGPCELVPYGAASDSFTVRLERGVCGLAVLPAPTGDLLDVRVIVQHLPHILGPWDSVQHLQCRLPALYRARSLVNSAVAALPPRRAHHYQGYNVTLELSVKTGHNPFGPFATSITIGEPLTLVATMVQAPGQGRPPVDMRSVNCFAHSPDYALRLPVTDEHGCLLAEHLFSDPIYRLRVPYGDAVSMDYVYFLGFQFPDQKILNFECDVEICYESCDHSCSQLSPLSKSVE